MVQKSQDKHFPRAGLMSEIQRDSGDWAFVDIGFSRDKKSGGLLVNNTEPVELTFSDMCKSLQDLGSTASSLPLNLVIEAPLSVAFNHHGNPTGRSIEKAANGRHRYWYAGLGCQVTLAGAYLLRSMLNAGISREVRLFEAFVSFKEKAKRSNHSADVLAMRAVAWREDGADGHIITPEELSVPEKARMASAFEVFGLDFGVPPVIVASPKCN